MSRNPHISVISHSTDLNFCLHQFPCDIFYFLSGYAKLSFYFLVLPFYPVNKTADGKLEFKRYLPHQLLCFFLHCSSLLFGITIFRSMLKETTFIHGSITIYELVVVIIVNVGCFISIWNCWWMKPNPYRKLLQVTFSFRDKTTVSCRRIRLYEYSVMLAACLQIAINANPEIMTYFKSSNVNYTTSTVLRVLYSGQAIYFQTLFQMVVIIPNLLAMFCMFMIGRSFRKVAEIEYSLLTSNFSKWQHLNSLERLMDYFLQVKRLTDVMNLALGKAVLVVCFSVLPTIGYGLAAMLSNDIQVRLEDHIRTVHILVFFYIFILLSATGVGHVKRFPEIAYEQLWRSRKLESISEQLTKASEMIGYVKAANVGFGGYPFFIIDYKYIGAVTGALVTYTIVMLQFRDTK